MLRARILATPSSDDDIRKNLTEILKNNEKKQRETHTEAAQLPATAKVIHYVWEEDRTELMPEDPSSSYSDDVIKGIKQSRRQELDPLPGEIVPQLEKQINQLFKKDGKTLNDDDKKIFKWLCGENNQVLNYSEIEAAKKLKLAFKDGNVAQQKDMDFLKDLQESEYGKMVEFMQAPHSENEVTKRVRQYIAIHASIRNLRLDNLIMYKAITRFVEHIHSYYPIKKKAGTSFLTDARKPEAICCDLVNRLDKDRGSVPRIRVGGEPSKWDQGLGLLPGIRMNRQTWQKLQMAWEEEEKAKHKVYNCLRLNKNTWDALKTALDGPPKEDVTPKKAAKEAESASSASSAEAAKAAEATELTEKESSDNSPARIPLPGLAEVSRLQLRSPGGDEKVEGGWMNMLGSACKFTKREWEAMTTFYDKYGMRQKEVESPIENILVTTIPEALTIAAYAFVI